MLTSFSIHPTASDLELLNLLTVILKENVGTIQPNVPMKLDHNDVETSCACGDTICLRPSPSPVAAAALHVKAELSKAAW